MRGSPHRDCRRPRRTRLFPSCEGLPRPRFLADVTSSPLPRGSPLPGSAFCAAINASPRRHHRPTMILSRRPLNMSTGATPRPSSRRCGTTTPTRASTHPLARACRTHRASWREVLVTKTGTSSPSSATLRAPRSRYSTDRRLVGCSSIRGAGRVVTPTLRCDYKSHRRSLRPRL